MSEFESSRFQLLDFDLWWHASSLQLLWDDPHRNATFAIGLVANSNSLQSMFNVLVDSICFLREKLLSFRNHWSKNATESSKKLKNAFDLVMQVIFKNICNNP